ncbi:DUF3046 domain-containing protein [Agreia pratensis]|uniref:DUF3046 domain-containing protein n=1 Tax=Agreia pratensis TaxID=150121 RepID=A0A1X7L0E9_9MICO|nr:DUF3046 domain-containing protein [Agreia pratensis]MBF4633787.1 DUF3046 domain-containing protein [Agreia pratensis]SMG46619.1 Protein of unknown function [Agreia pratensis]
MRLSEFRRAVSDEFGAAYGRVLTGDLVIAELSDRTADEALRQGVSAREVWLALCRASGVPESRWHGVGLPSPRP